MRRPVKQGAGSATAARAKARGGLRRAEAGDAEGAEQIEQADRADPPETEAAEQEASDGPDPAGLAR
jgi:hypothetical protein